MCLDFLFKILCKSRFRHNVLIPQKIQKLWDNADIFILNISLYPQKLLINVSMKNSKETNVLRSLSM